MRHRVVLLPPHRPETSLMNDRKLAQIRFVIATVKASRVLDHVTHCPCCRRMLDEYEAAADDARTPRALADLIAHANSCTKPT